MSPFQFGLMVLEAYVRREGNARVPVPHRERAFSFRLGLWAAGRRQQYRRGELSPERIVALEALPGWVWNVSAARRVRVFNAGLEKLRVYVKEHGHARVPEGCCVGGFRLWSWVARRRMAYRSGRLSRQEVRALEVLPGWSWSPHAEDFEKGLAHLKTFVRRHGHALVPGGGVLDGFPLGRWVQSLRRRRREGRLSRRYQAALKAVPGWSWEPQRDAFQRALARLRRFAEREGHTWVPWGYRKGGILLDAWVGRYRREKQRGQLSAARQRALEAIPGWAWERPRESAFDRGLRQLRGFLERHGHSRVPMKYVVEGRDLHLWVLSVREQKRKGALTRRQEKALEALPGWRWEPFHSQFEDGLRHLRAFAEREGHARVPASHVEGGFKLGAWVGKKRRMYREGRLSGQWIGGLERFRGWVWEARTATRETNERLRTTRRQGPQG